MEIEDHHAGVEVARPTAGEGAGEAGIGPEAVGEVLGEVGVAVLGGADGARVEARAPELRDVVDEDEIGVEVNDATDTWLEDVGEVVAGVVERLLEGGADGGGDQPADTVRVEYSTP
ncbi:hypothetical protein J5N97_014007 [Dioscorea zingiberensis]|uniref:Uncharacterized protein n=1 Tax=Dioscorea zingiberensis TaxID=325984 RepID=A0A9D5CUA4_9LILI|nr:hypothetical protein J5N97_014007 [Dioscorea zingiberensis]